MTDVRRFDSLEKVVRDDRRALDDLAATTLSRLGSHAHSDLYYTEAEMNTLLAAKAALLHAHSGADITSGTISNARLPTTITGRTMNGNFDLNGTMYSAASGGAINGQTDRSSPWFGLDGNGPYYRLFWSGSNIQFVNADTNTVTKTFVIEHPSDKSKYLVHATTESPHNGVEYWGTTTLQDGEGVVVELPDYFEPLTAEAGRAVLLTPILNEPDRPRPSWAQPKNAEPLVPMTLIPNVAASYPKGGRFRVVAQGSCPPLLEVSWLVKAIRRDVPELNVEPKKSDYVLLGDGPYTFLVKKLSSF